jgi:hypothetical protein
MTNATQPYPPTPKLVSTIAIDFDDPPPPYAGRRWLVTIQHQFDSDPRALNALVHLDGSDDVVVVGRAAIVDGKWAMPVRVIEKSSPLASLVDAAALGLAASRALRDFHKG